MRTVAVTRLNGSFGLKVASNEDGRGVHVLGMTAGGAAEIAGGIRLNDFVCRVNATNVLFSSHDDVIAVIKTSGDVLTLVVAGELTDEVCEDGCRCCS